MTHQRTQTLVVMCVGMALLIGIAVNFSATNRPYLSSTELVAATVHGTASGFAPAPSSCATDQTASGLCANPTSRSAIFSVHLPDTVVTVPGACRTLWRWTRCEPDTITASGRTITEQCRMNGTSCVAGSGAGNAVSISIPKGARITLELDWLMRQYVGWPNGCDWFCGDKHDWATVNFLSTCTNDFGLTTSDYDGHHQSGSILLTPTESRTYTVTCSGSGTSFLRGTGLVGPSTFTLSIPVTVNDAVARPTLTITGNGANPATATVGQPINIASTFAVAPGDTLISAAINDATNTSVPGVPQTPATSKNYTFTPSAPGTYTFYPAARTLAYPTWDNHGASLVITVTGESLCSGPNEVGTPPSCTCASGYERNPGGVCTPEVGVTPVTPVTPGGGAACTGLNEVGTQPLCQCAANTQRENGICSRVPSLSIEINGEEEVRVHKDSSVEITWSASNVRPGSCTVSNGAGTVLWSTDRNPSPAPTAVAVGQTVYTLSCLTDGGNQVYDEAFLTLIPSFI